MPSGKILVADDELHMTYILSFKLERAGYNVITAGDGQEAFALACAHHPDLVITDFQMPTLSGLDMALKLRKNPATAHIPLLMLTARGHRVGADELAMTNIRRLLGKPFSIRELLTTVEHILAKEPARPDAAAPAMNITRP